MIKQTRLVGVILLLILLVTGIVTVAQSPQPASALSDVEVSPLALITVQNAAQLTQWVPIDHNGQQPAIWNTMAHGTLLTTVPSPAGNLIAAGSSTGLYLFDIHNPQNEPVHAVGFNQRVNSITFSPNGMKLIVQSDSSPNKPYLYDVAEARFYPLADDPQLTRYSGMQFSDDSSTVFANGYNSQLYQLVTWNAQTGRRIAAREISELSRFLADSSPRQPNVTLIITPDAFITAHPLEVSYTNTTHVVQWWDKDTLAALKQIKLAAEASTFIYLPEQNWFVTSGYMNEYNGALVWDANTGSRITTIAVRGGLHLASDGASLEFQDRDTGIVKVWDLASQQITGEHPYEASQDGEKVRSYFTDFTGKVLFTPSGDKFVVVSGGIQKWDVDNWVPEMTIPVGKYIRDLALAPDGMAIAAAIGDWAEGDRLHIYDLAAGTLTSTFQYEAPFEALTYSPDGELLAVGRNQAFDLALYNPHTANVVSRYSEGGVPKAVAFSPDGQSVASGNADGKLRVYSTATQQALYVIEMDERIGSLAFSPDGKVLAVADPLTFLDAQTGESLVNPIPDMRGLSASRVAKLAALLQEGTIEQLRAALDSGSFTREQMQLYREYTSSITSMVFSPDGSLLATIGERRFTLWDVATGYSVWDKAIDASTPYVAFHPDGNIIITSNNGLALWVINTGIDSDQDGFDDVQDGCPKHAGDINGCPDGDADGFPDPADVCPDEAGSAAGCPDDDKDEVGNPDDLCPAEIGSIAAKGCPDGDADGIIDGEDLCPVEAGVKAFEGCPDTDADGVADTDDACPSYAGTAETEGCPPIGHTSTNANIRNTPSTNGTVLRSIPSGEEFYIIGRNAAGDWLHIVLDSDGSPTNAWVYSELVVTDVDTTTLPVQD